MWLIGSFAPACFAGAGLLSDLGSPEDLYPGSASGLRRAGHQESHRREPPKTCAAILRRGLQFPCIGYGELLARIGATTSIGALRDSYGNTLSETLNGYYKVEPKRGSARLGPWRTIDDLELETLSWVHWHNTGPLHGYQAEAPPTEF